MTGVAFAAILLLLLGIFLEVPVAVILSIVVLMIEAVRQVWTRFGLSGVSYRRRLERDRIGWGEEIPAIVEIWNRKRLPPAWLPGDDAAAPGRGIRQRPPPPGRTGSALPPNPWPLPPVQALHPP